MTAAEQEPVTIIPDGSAKLLAQLALHPTADVRCSLHSGDPAVAVFATPEGCVARPHDRVQALCLQHIETDGVSPGTQPILDLSAGGAWSQMVGVELPLHLGYDLQRLETALAGLGIAGIELADLA